MKLEAIRLNKLDKNQVITSRVSKIRNNETQNTAEVGKQQVYASHLGFKGGKQIPALLDEYKWAIRHDKLPAALSFMKLEAPAESLDGVFRCILADKDLSYEFIDSFSTQPRQIKHVVAALREKLPANSDILNIFAYDNPYKKAYANYLEARVQNAKSVSELLTIRPDWDEQVLIQKHRELYHNDDFELGVVPNSIGADNYTRIIEYLKNYVDIGFKTKKNISDLNINGQVFKFENFIDGKSDKNVFKITTPSGEAFILKMGKPEERGLNKPFAIGTLAMIDTYLTKNNCRNSAPIRYYHHNSNTSLYEFIEHNKADTKFTTSNAFTQNMPDFADLGLTQNDTVGSNNYFKLEANQKAMQGTYDFQYGVDHKEFISVDNDHVTYNQLLCPVDYKYNKPLPCEMQMFF